MYHVMCSADGIVIESHGLIIDEASLTGEADPIKKTLEDPWVRSGTQVSNSALCLGQNEHSYFIYSSLG